MKSNRLDYENIDLIVLKTSTDRYVTDLKKVAKWQIL